MNKKIILFFATGFYSGYLPLAPGTFGTIAGLPFVFVLLIIEPYYYAFYIIGLILVSIYLSDKASKILKEQDPGCIVIDEIAGYVLTMSLVKINLFSLIAGFIIFRFFDITKCKFVKYFENNFSGGAAIVLDDIMAGFLSAFVLKVTLLSYANIF